MAFSSRLGCLAAACVLCGCTSSATERGAAPAADETPEIDWSTASVAMTIHELDFPMVSLTSGNRVKVILTYSKEHIPLNRLGDWKGSENSYLGKMFPIVPLVLYLQHAALVYLESGEVLPYVKVNEVKTVAEGRGPAGDDGWFFDYPAQAFWCRNTLACRLGDDVQDFLENSEGLPRDWVPLTRKSYDEWWQALDARLHLMEVFGKAPEGAAPGIEGPEEPPGAAPTPGASSA